MKQFQEALTFDDVLLKPAASSVLPNQTETRTRLTRTVELGIPLMSAAMDTVTEAPMAIAMAQAGGIGVIHKNLDAEAQANAVRKVKKFESGMVVNPLTIHPDQSLADALGLMSAHQISGIPVVERKSGKLVGVLTNRDVRFATDTSQSVSSLMTRERLVTVREGASQEEAKRLLHQYRIEKLLVVDDAYRCIGLITVKDMEKANKFPGASKDEKGRLRVAAATGVGTPRWLPVVAGTDGDALVRALGLPLILKPATQGSSVGMTKVTEATQSLLLEAAHFDALSVRRTARALGMRTEASYRFERTVDPAGVERALDLRCLVIALGECRDAHQEHRQGNDRDREGNADVAAAI